MSDMDMVDMDMVDISWLPYSIGYFSFDVMSIVFHNKYENENSRAIC